MKLDKYSEKIKKKLKYTNKKTTKPVVWCLFDSGTGSYYSYLKDDENFEVYSLGASNKELPEGCINLFFNPIPFLFEDYSFIENLNQLPKPDVIIASPPCESWSIASSMNKGNSSWRHLKGNGFEIRPEEDYLNNKVQYKFTRSYLQRLNGEMTAYLTCLLITICDPKVYIIENPKQSKIWEYFDKILNLKLENDNLTYYNLYGLDIKKPTCFKSNIKLNLLNDNSVESIIKFKHYSKDYNVRSHIPLTLVKNIFEEVGNYLNDNKNK